MTVASKKDRRPVKPEDVKPPDPPEQPPVADEPKPRAFVPKPCCACRALRPVGTNYSRVYATRHEGATIVRYVKCDFCGATYRETGAS